MREVEMETQQWLFALRLLAMAGCSREEMTYMMRLEAA